MDLEARIEKSKRKFIENTVICGSLILLSIAIIFIAKFNFNNPIVFIFAMFIFLVISIVAMLVYMSGVVEYNSLKYTKICEAQLISRKYYDDYTINNQKKSNVIVYKFKILYTGEQVSIIKENIIDETQKYCILGTEKDIVQLYCYRKILGSGWDIRNYYEIKEYYDIKRYSELKVLFNARYRY